MGFFPFGVKGPWETGWGFGRREGPPWGFLGGKKGRGPGGRWGKEEGFGVFKKKIKKFFKKFGPILTVIREKKQF